MTPTNDRQKVLYFTEPYNYTPAVVVVGADDNDVSDLSTDLDGKKIGVCSGCTYEQFLDKKLAIDGYTFDFIIDDAEISGYDTDTTALQDLANGAPRRGDHLADHRPGLHRRRQPGEDRRRPGVLRAALGGLRQELGPVLGEPVQAVDAIVGDMHEDGTLTALSEKWYGLDLTTQQ